MAIKHPCMGIMHGNDHKHHLPGDPDGDGDAHPSGFKPGHGLTSEGVPGPGDKSVKVKLADKMRPKHDAIVSHGMEEGGETDGMWSAADRAKYKSASGKAFNHSTKAEYGSNATRKTAIKLHKAARDAAGGQKHLVAMHDKEIERIGKMK